MCGRKLFGCAGDERKMDPGSGAGVTEQAVIHPAGPMGSTGDTARTASCHFSRRANGEHKRTVRDEKREGR